MTITSTLKLIFVLFNVLPFFSPSQMYLCDSSIGSIQSLYSHPSYDDEFVGPFPSWLNVKIQFGATGDGITDDTKALQAALDSLGNTDNAAKVVYLPAGTYLISQTLSVRSKQFISIIGADPATTTIKWVGVPGGTMLTVNGVWYSRFNRITWDGSSTAGTAIGQNWDGTVEYFDTGNEYADDVFTDVGFGIKGGFSYSISFAETAIMRCKFIRNTSAGIATGNYNALDTWIWNSLFQDCRIGVTNVADHGAGNFRVYNSVFRNSTVSDIYIGNVREFSFRDNTSTNSQAFIIALYNPNPIPMVIQGNTIIDPLSNSPIQIYQQGPVSLIDNIIRSRAGATGPVILCNAPKNDADFFAVGNIFTINNPIKADKSILYDNSIVGADSLSKLQEQKLPGVQPNLHRRVFEVPAGSGTKVLQNAINQASAEVGSRSVVHIPYGKYIIDSTLTIPAGSDVQIVGDGYSTQLAGAGRGPVMHIMGPSKATLRDVNINGNNSVSGIIVTDIDQTGSRVFMHELKSHNNDTGMLVKGLDNTVLLMYNSGFTFSNKGIEVIGGPLAAAGTPGMGRVIMYAGCNLGNVISHKVSNGGNLSVRDYWYESNQSNQYLNISGPSTFVMEAGCANNPAVISVPQFMLNNFSGKATFLNSFITDRIAVTGDGSQAKILGLGMHSYNDQYIYDSTSPEAKVRSLGSRTTDHNSNVSGSGSYSKADIGSMEVNFITEMLESVRNVHTQILTPLADDISDLRFYRVWTGACTKGIELQGNTPDSTIEMPIYRINAGGGEVMTSKGIYSADAYFWPVLDDTYFDTSNISGTTDDSIYQSERTGSNGTFGYAFPVSNGQYTVILHFAEIYHKNISNRIFDVSIEGIKLLDNYDIFKKVGGFNAATEIFGVNVTDGILNINFSSLAKDGGLDRAKISAIEIVSIKLNPDVTENSSTHHKTSVIFNSLQQTKIEVQQKLLATVQPNPSAHCFNLNIIGNKNLVNIKIFNSGGQFIEAKLNANPGYTIQFGKDYTPGLYYAVILQGNDKVILKLIKENN